MSEAKWRLERYVFELDLGHRVPRELEPMVENMLRAIPGVEEAYLHVEWAEVKVLQEYVDEVPDINVFWVKLREQALEVAAVVQTACLLLTKIEGEK